MAVDKLVDSAALDSDLDDIADAILAKSGGTGPLAFRAGADCLQISMRSTVEPLL